MSIENINEHNGKVGSATRLNFPPMTDALIWRVRVRHLQGHLSSSLSKAKQAHLQWKGMGQMGTWERLLTLLFLLSAVSAEHEGRPVCPTIGTTTSSTRLQSSDPVKSFNEISGLALSPVQTGELVTSRASVLQCERVMLIVTHASSATFSHFS